MALGPTQLPTGRGLLPTELTGMWGWILLRSSHQGRGSPPAPAPTKQRPGGGGGLPFASAGSSGSTVRPLETDLPEINASPKCMTVWVRTPAPPPPTLDARSGPLGTRGPTVSHHLHPPDLPRPPRAVMTWLSGPALGRGTIAGPSRDLGRPPDPLVGHTRGFRVPSVASRRSAA